MRDAAVCVYRLTRHLLDKHALTWSHTMATVTLYNYLYELIKNPRLIYKKEPLLGV